MSLLRIQDLQVALDDVPMLRSVSLEVGAGEILGLVGESGAGKSMTALAIMGLLPPRARLSGSIQLDRAELATASEDTLRTLRGRDIGMVFQEPMTALNPLMTIGDQVAETVRIHRRASRGEARDVARRTLERVGLPADRFPLDRYPHELSGGQRQRVAIAAAVALAPRLLIADEPATALDVTTQAHILALLKRLVGEDGAAMILITHDLAVVVETADRLAVMQAGEIVEQAQAGAGLKALRHPYSRRLLADAGHVPVRHWAAAPSATPVLEAENIVCEYRGARRLFGRSAPQRAVDGVSLSIHAGETVGLVGESGSGKTTLVRTLLALDRPRAGEVKVHGQSFTNARGAALKRLRRHVQVVFQDPYGSFDPRWRVEQLVAENFHLLEQRPEPREARRRVEAVLDQVGLSSGDADRFPHEFSGGQRQRIAIARALITEPDVVVLDEAVSALDVTVRARILDLLAELSDRLCLAYLFVAHDLAVVRSIADRVLVMKDGRVVEEGAADAVFTAPRHPYTVELLAATPSLERALGAPSGRAESASA